jgi:hypothetical protein
MGSRRTTLAAIHQVDVETVLGAPLPATWRCYQCQSEHSGVPAAYVKRDGSLRYLCFQCLLALDDDAEYDPDSPRHAT